ncbi:MAG: hypothetical protein SP4CHLAM5_07690 [Chlamydiia bacterium]|nr:hypothetical protein [Chlamydiia bacterium]
MIERKRKQTIAMAAILLFTPVALFLAALATGTLLPYSVYLLLLLANIAGMLTSFRTPKMKKIMRFVPIRSLLAAALIFQCLETLHQKQHASIPFAISDFYPLALIATFLFTLRASRLRRV